MLSVIMSADVGVGQAKLEYEGQEPVMLIPENKDSSQNKGGQDSSRQYKDITEEKIEL